MRMLKSGLKLVLDLDWIFDEDNGDLADIVVNHNTYDGVVYWQESLEMAPILAGFDVKLPQNHRYVITYHNLNTEAVGTGYFDTFGVEEQYASDLDEDNETAGFQLIFLYFYDIDGGGVGGSSLPIIIADMGTRFSPLYMGSYNLRVYQID